MTYASVALFRVTLGQIAEGWVLADRYGLVRRLKGEA